MQLVRSSHGFSRVYRSGTAQITIYTELVFKDFFCPGLSMEDGFRTGKKIGRDVPMVSIMEPNVSMCM